MCDVSFLQLLKTFIISNALIIVVLECAPIVFNVVFAYCDICYRVVCILPGTYLNIFCTIYDSELIWVVS